MKGIDKSTRLTNYLIDQTIIFIACTPITLILGESVTPHFLYYAVYFLYYLFSETITSQTIGKKITKTYVVDKKGKKPGFLKIFQRSVLRLVPIDPLSYLYGTENGLYDVLSSTRIIKKEKITLRKV